LVLLAEVDADRIQPEQRGNEKTSHDDAQQERGADAGEPIAPQALQSLLGGAGG
jgi:hypothetical protein